MESPVRGYGVCMWLMLVVGFLVFSVATALVLGAALGRVNATRERADTEVALRTITSPG